MEKVLKKFRKEDVAARFGLNNANQNLGQLVVYIEDENDKNNMDTTLARVGVNFDKETKKVSIMYIYLFRIYETPNLVEGICFSLANQGEYHSCEAHFIPDMEKYNPGDNNSFVMFNIDNKEEMSKYISDLEFNNVKNIQQLMTREKEEFKSIIPYIVNNFYLPR